MSKRTAEHMTWHARSPAKDGELTHPADGRAWKEFNIKHPEFASKPRNVRLGLCTDGFNPFGYSATLYSCWPVIVIPYNLPPWMCMKQSYIFLSLMIPGPKSPGRNLDLYLRPLIDELKELWENGVQTWDVSTKTNFNLKAAIMWTISDFPAYGMLSGWSTHGKMACPYCMENTKSFNLPHGRKPCWFDCHRRFLPEGHSFRRDREHFRRGNVENDGPAPRLSGVQLHERVMRLPVIPFGRNNAIAMIDGFGQSHNWVRRSIFWELPYWSTNLIRHNLDVMHIEKNVFDNIFNTVMNIKDKTKDNEKARLDMKDICKRPGLEIYRSPAGKMVKPHAKFTLSKPHVDDVCAWIKSLKLPDGYASNISRCVAAGGRLQGMKSHDCHVFMERLMPLAFRDLLDRTIWDTLTELSHFFRDICSKSLRETDVDILERNIIQIVCKLEKIFPPGFFDSMEHLLIHLPYEARVGGPVQFRWMYSCERGMGVHKKRVKNKAYVEGSICEAYSFDEISLFVSDYFPGEVLTKANRAPRNDDGGEVALNGRLSVFGLSGCAYGKQNLIHLEEKQLHAAHTCILLNCEEIDKFVREYDEELRTQQHDITGEQIQLSRDKFFAHWLKDKVLNGDPLPHNVKALTLGPDRCQFTRNGYKVNGYNFHTKDYAKRRKTINSGVCVQGDCYNEVGHTFYGELEQIIELTYKGTYGGQITLFKCRWFDSEKGIRVDRHGIVDIDLHRTTYANAPYVLPTQTQQVYYTMTYGRKRDRPPANWHAVIHTPARTRFQLVEGEFFQEETVRSPSPVNVDDSHQINQLESGGDGEELDSDFVERVNYETDDEEEELLTDTDTEVEELDGYESPLPIDSDSEDDH